MGRFAILWFWQASRLNAEWFEVYSYDNEERARPSLTRSPIKPTNAEPWSFSSVDDNGRLVVHIPKDHLPDAPPMWYLLVREYHKLSPTQTLIAFDNEIYPDGTVVEAKEFLHNKLDSSKRIAAIRWGFGDPHIEQLYVAESHRRRRVSIKLINVADVVNVAGNWGGFIYGGDQVTELGAKLSETWTHSSRLKPATVHLPPMD